MKINMPILDDIMKMISFAAMVCLIAWVIYNYAI